jgi:hypothetical protein
MEFSEKLYDNDIWGDLSDHVSIHSSNFYHNHGSDSSNEWMYKLYELTYNYINTGRTHHHDSPSNMYEYFTSNVVNKETLNYNLIFHTNINNNNNKIGSNNINAVSYSSNAFPIDIF